MKIKQLIKPVILIAAFILFAACNAEAYDQTPAESSPNLETYEPEYREIAMEPTDEYDAYELEEHLGTPDSDSNQQVAEETPQSPTEVTQIPLTEERVERLTSFIADFGGWFGASPALGDYDVDSPDSIYVALDFVLSSRVFRHGREGILGYPHYGYAVYMGGERFFSGEVLPDGMAPGFEFITTAYVDSVLWSLFGITGFVHGASEYTPTFGFRHYYGGYYYRFLAQGGGDFAVIDIAALYDNGNGTYSVVIEYLWADWSPDGERLEPEHMQYNIAVIQPFANTYQMLYWQNNVPRDTTIPVRQPTS